MTWERFRCTAGKRPGNPTTGPSCASDPDNCISDKLVRQHADILAQPEWKAAGYSYVNIDGARTESCARPPARNCPRLPRALTRCCVARPPSACPPSVRPSVCRPDPDCWSEWNRTAAGKLVPNAARFPQGMKALADYVHSKGLHLGTYNDM
eukprot:SAG22_NODE_1745_length_3666_cov_1.403140_3_plen_152_part_00